MIMFTSISINYINLETTIRKILYELDMLHLQHHNTCKMALNIMLVECYVNNKIFRYYSQYVLMYNATYYFPCITTYFLMLLYFVSTAFLSFFLFF